MSVPLDSPFPSHVKHVLGRGPNISLLVPLVHPCILLESHVALEERSCWLRHYLFGTDQIPDPTLTDQPLPTNRYQLTVWSVFGEVPKPFGCFNLTLPITLQNALTFSSSN